MEEELEVLESIYLGDHLRINLSESRTKAEVSIQCQPRGDDQIFVSATLLLQLTERYPLESPVVSLTNLSNIDEKDRLQLLEQLNLIITESKGESVCFSLIEHLADQLGKLNSEARCHICLSPLLGGGGGGHDSKSRSFSTPCQHHYHTNCLGRWWHECIVSKHCRETRMGGEDAATGREREVFARQKILDSKLVAAEKEFEISTSSVSIIQNELDEVLLQYSKNKRKPSKSELASRDLIENELKTNLNLAEQRLETATSALSVATDRVEKGKLSLKSAHDLAAAASEENELKLVSEIPCPVCRSCLKIEDSPFNTTEFMNAARKLLGDETK